MIIRNILLGFSIICLQLTSNLNSIDEKDKKETNEKSENYFYQFYRKHQTLSKMALGGIAILSHALIYLVAYKHGKDEGYNKGRNDAKCPNCSCFNDL